MSPPIRQNRTSLLLPSLAWNDNRDAEQDDDDSDHYQSWYAADGAVPLSV